MGIAHTWPGSMHLQPLRFGRACAIKCNARALFAVWWGARTARCGLHHPMCVRALALSTRHATRGMSGHVTAPAICQRVRNPANVHCTGSGRSSSSSSRACTHHACAINTSKTPGRGPKIFKRFGPLRNKRIWSGEITRFRSNC